MTKGFEPFIVADNLERYCRLDNTKSRFKSPMVRPEEQESSLQKLPTEVYHNVLQYLDVGTLTSMRSVSQYTRSSIDSLHPYKELYEFAPQVLRACLSTEMAPHIPLLRLHKALTILECHYCKQSYVTPLTSAKPLLTRTPQRDTRKHIWNLPLTMGRPSNLRLLRPKLSLPQARRTKPPYTPMLHEKEFTSSHIALFYSKIEDPSWLLLHDQS